MKIKFLASILWLALLAMFTGCAIVSPEQVQAEIAKVGYGMDPAPGWQDRIRAFMELRLKDSSSAVYKFGELEKGYLTNPPIQGGGLKAAGYVVSVQINAKNSYGGYTGFESYKFFLRDNRVISSATLHGDFWLWD